MPKDQQRDVLAELTALQREVAALREVQGARRPRNGLVVARARLVAAVALTLLVAVVPATILAATPFTDLTGGVHDANIDAIYAAGVTRGCVPDQEFCPTANVTREEMASFLARLGGLGSDPPVANARTAQTATSATNAGHATTADTAISATTATSAQCAAHATTANTAQSADQATNAGNAATVGGYAPAGLVRTARAIGAHRIDTDSPAVLTVTTEVYPPTIPTAFNSLVTVTITAPAAGFVTVTGSHLFMLVFAEGFTRLRHAETGATSVLLNCGQINASMSCALAPVYVFPVAAGEQTFVMEVATQTSVGAGQAANGVLTALYVPFGPTGGSTLDTP